MSKDIRIKLNYSNTSNPFNIKYVNGLKATISDESFEDSKENCESATNRSRENIIKVHSGNDTAQSMQEILKKLNQNIVLQNGSQKPALEVLDTMLQTEVFNKERKVPVREVIMTFESVKQKAIDDATKEVREIHAARVNLYEADIEKLRDQLIQSNLRIGTLEKCTSTSTENATLKQENRRLSNEAMVSSRRQIEDLNATIVSKEGKYRVTVEKFIAQLAEKDAKADSLATENSARFTSWQLSDNTTKQKMCELDAAISQYQTQIKELNAGIATRDEKIKELNSETILTAERSKREIAQFGQTITTLNQTIASADLLRKKEVSVMTAEINEMDASHNTKISEIRSQMASEVVKYNSTISDLTEDMQKRQVEHHATLVAASESKSLALQELRRELKEFVETAQKERKTAFEERDKHKGNYTKERKMRITLHNQLVELQGNIRVICRVRPVNDYELESTNGGSDVITNVLSDSELAVSLDRRSVTGEVSSKSARVQKFEFDKVFGPSSTQEEVFEAVQPLCISFLDGFNICIFAYGQTGSGKTFTMEGNGTGVSPRCMVELFSLCEERESLFDYKFTFSMMQIHNDAVYDLLGNLDTKLTIHQTEGGKFEITDATEMELVSAQQALDLIAHGQSNRVVAAHSLNQDSSRSHSIITIKMTGVNKIDGGTCTPAKLHLIDLAGSERLGKTGAKGESLVEANNINKSLLALGDVVNALAIRASHIPYRNSKLTFLLQESLGGNSKVFTFVNISPAQFNSGETVCSLNFAARCRLTTLAKEEGGQGKRSSFTSITSILPITTTTTTTTTIATTHEAVSSRSASPVNISGASSVGSLNNSMGAHASNTQLGTTTTGALLTSRSPVPKRKTDSGWNSYSKGNIVL
jgi:hypothetical protein